MARPITSSANCGFCAADNPVGANYCINCGAPLDLRTCPQCEWVNQRAASACSKCGTALCGGSSAGLALVTDKAIETAGLATNARRARADQPVDSTLVAPPTDQKNLKALLAQLQDDVNRLASAKEAAATVPKPEPRREPSRLRVREVKREPLLITSVAPKHPPWHLPALVLMLAGLAASGYYFYEENSAAPRPGPATSVRVPALLDGSANPARGQRRLPAPPPEQPAQSPTIPVAAVATSAAGSLNGSTSAAVQPPPSASPPPITSPSIEPAAETAQAPERTKVAPARKSESRTTKSAAGRPSVASKASATVTGVTRLSAEATPARAPAAAQPAGEKLTAGIFKGPCSDAARAMGLCDGPSVKDRNPQGEEQK